MAVTLDSRIPEIIALSEERAATAVAKTVLDIEAGAKRRLIEHGSVDTGNLLGSIEGHSEGTSGEVSTGVEYAPYLEFGTGRRGEASEFPGKPADLTYSEDWAGMAARPYMIPSAEEAREPFEMAVASIYG